MFYAKSSKELVYLFPKNALQFLPSKLRKTTRFSLFYFI